MKANAEELNYLLLHSSSVEELEKNSPLKIRYGPHYIFMDTVTLKVILCSEVYGRTTAALYNSKENIIFFANKVHMKQCLRQWGLAEDTLNEYLVELIIEEESEEVIPTIIFSHPLIQLVMLYTFIAIIDWRLRKSKFPYKSPVGHKPQGLFLFKNNLAVEFCPNNVGAGFKPPLRLCKVVLLELVKKL